MLIPAPSPKNPSFVFIRLRSLSFSVYNIFPFKRFAFNPFRTLSRNGGWVSTLPKVELDTQHSSPSNLFKFFLFTLLHTLWRNGRNTTLLESIRSALFLSQWGWRGTFSASGRRCGPREAQRRGASQILSLGFRLASIQTSAFGCRLRLPARVCLMCYIHRHRLLLPPQRRHRRIIVRQEIAHHDAHRSPAQQLPRRIVVACGGPQGVALAEPVPALVEEHHDRSVQQP